jgi:serine/threonine-protein kinase
LTRQSPEAWGRVRALVEQALVLSPAERPAFLDAACADDPALRGRVDRLVAACERSEGEWEFLARPAGEIVAPLVAAALTAGRADILARLNAAIGDRYLVERELSVGGMATVYVAHDVRHSRRVAIKVLHPELSAVLGAERFLTEIKTTASLQHPHILPLFDSGSADGLLFYVMPFVEGETLRDRLKREKKLSVTEAVRIAVEIADALDYAHRRGVIHRDIKPENILLHEGQPVVADFGIALAVQSAGDERITRPGLPLGTPQYMSPEQTTGEQEITARSDTYALGAVTYEMLTGGPPFAGETIQQIVTRVRSDEPLPISAQRKRVPPHVESAVFIALEKLPADRFDSVAEFARALNDADFRGPIRIRPGGLRSTPRRNRSLDVALGALALGLAIAAGWGWSRGFRAPDVVRFTMDLPADVSIVLTVPSGNIAVSPDGRVVVFVGSAADGTRRLYGRALNDVTPRALAGTTGAANPFFSPDGRWIAFWSGGKLQKVAAEGGLPQTVTVPAANFDGGTWTSRGVIVYAAGGSLYSVASGGGIATLLAAPDRSRGETEFLFPVALPDGDHVLYTSGTADGGVIGIAALSGRSAKSLGVSGAMALGVIDGHAIYATRDNTLMAVPLDASGGRATGVPVAVATNVSVNVTGSSNASLSRSGTLAYRAGIHGSRIVLTNGRDPIRVMGADVKAYAFPRFSPDGKRIAISVDAGSRSDVWVYDTASHTSTRLSSGGTENDRPEWTPDGTRVLYRTDGTGAGNTSIWWRSTDLTGPAQPLLSEPNSQYFEAVMAPGGRAVVYQLDNDIGMRAFAGDTTPRLIARTEYTENQARVSPDGRWVAFMTDESGTAQIVVQPLPGPGPRVQVSSNGGIEPVWSRDGRRLFYRANKKFMVATIAATPTFTVTARDVFADDRFLLAAAPHANYDVAPDGTSLLVLEALEDPKILIVQNWAEEVRARLKTPASKPK